MFIFVVIMGKAGVSEIITAHCSKAWHSSGKGRWLLAVSGGADSVSLLLGCKLAGITAEAAHCNFNLRGDESIRDREFVKNLCDDFDIPLHTAEFDTFREAEKGESVEMTCRRLRYSFFRQLMKDCSFCRIAVAHNADDNIETFFLNFLRGCGSRGLKGMQPDSGEIIRPLLHVGRKEIIDFLNRHSVPYIVDSTNLESDYRRNFLRNEVFPLLESRWEGFRKAVGTTIAIQAKENAIVEKAVADCVEGCGDLLPWDVVQNFADPTTLIFHFIRPVGGTPSVAGEMAKSAQERIPGKRWTMGVEAEAFFTREGIAIRRKGLPAEEEKKPQYCCTALETSPVLLNKIRNAPLTEIYLPHDENHYEWVFPSNEMSIKSLGMKGSQKIMKILKDAGVPAHVRKRVPVLTDRSSGEAVWIPGLKRSRLHLITPDTPLIYHLTKEGLGNKQQEARSK